MQLHLFSTSLLAVARKLVNFAEVPALRKDEFFPLIDARIQVRLSGDKFEVFGNGAPMLAGVLPLAVIGHRVWIRRCVHVPFACSLCC